MPSESPITIYLAELRTLDGSTLVVGAFRKLEDAEAWRVRATQADMADDGTLLMSAAEIISVIPTIKPMMLK